MISLDDVTCTLTGRGVRVTFGHATAGSWLVLRRDSSENPPSTCRGSALEADLGVGPEHSGDSWVHVPLRAWHVHVSGRKLRQPNAQGPRSTIFCPLS